MNKRIIAIILAACAAACAAGCSSGDKNTDEQSSATEETVQAASTDAKSEDAVAVDATEAGEKSESGAKSDSDEASEAESDAKSESGGEAKSDSEAKSESGSKTKSESGSKAADLNTNGAIDADGVSVLFGDGGSITLGAAANEVLSALGEPEDTLETPRADNTKEVVYFYEDVAVTTQPDADGKDIVTEVELLSDGAKLANGISLDSTIDDVKAAFGGDAVPDELGRVKYTLEKIAIEFIFDDNVVTTLAVSLIDAK